METEEELNAKIMAKIAQIHDKHPELSKFLSEMPVTIPNEKNPEINVKILRDYYESLKDMIKQFA